MSQPLIVLHEHGNRPPLFCIHPVGGHANAYLCLRGLLDPDQPLYAICSRARVASELEHATLQAMAEDYATIVQNAARGPYRLFGWSMGGLTAHAIACELERRGEVVEVVAMVDPQVGPLPPTADDLRTAVAMAIQIFHPVPPPGAVIRRELRLLDIREVGPAIASWCITRGLVPDDVAIDQFVGAMRLFWVHRDLVSAVTQPGICRAPIILWKAREQSRIPHDWAKHTLNTFRIRLLEADHFSIMRPPFIDAIAADLSEPDLWSDRVT